MAAPGVVNDDSLRRSLEEELGADKIRTDADSRHLFATDASPCVVEPRAVVSVRSEGDIVRVLRVARNLRVPVTPRAGGTSLSGAAIGPGIVIDTTRFGRILDFNPTGPWVRVEPGILLSDLNAFPSEKGLRFAPDPGSQDVCRIGGMVGHNASGYRSMKYGQTRDHVLALRVVLADGTAVDAQDVQTNGPEWKELIDRVPAFESIRRKIAVHTETILASRRPVRKHACGYDALGIAESLRKGVFPLASPFVGSEGTLGIVTAATLRVVPIPRRRTTVLVYLDRFADLGRLVADLLPLGPSAMEAVDGDSLALLDREVLGVPASARAMLLVEFDEGDLEAIATRLAEGIAPRYPLSRPLEIARTTRGRPLCGRSAAPCSRRSSSVRDGGRRGGLSRIPWSRATA